MATEVIGNCDMFDKCPAKAACVAHKKRYSGFGNSPLSDARGRARYNVRTTYDELRKRHSGLKCTDLKEVTFKLYEPPPKS